ncbi:hypothetical protein GDO81_018624 [Engystomops pustulosus]|uniref:Uncharacterized protein n=1 Tax=Engystomops pustulosus TaxID=76066 RepID=A0AAV6ZE98_ENGPU|nr:hypothetical protein GDO81_018624 [Engystomops pustulosus]
MYSQNLSSPSSTYLSLWHMCLHDNCLFFSFASELIDNTAGYVREEVISTEFMYPFFILSHRVNTQGYYGVKGHKFKRCTRVQQWHGAWTRYSQWPTMQGALPACRSSNQTSVVRDLMEYPSDCADVLW